MDKRKWFFCLSVFVVVLILIASCDSTGSSSSVEDESYQLGGTMGESDVKLSFDVMSDSGASRAASIRELQGYLIYDDFTLDCWGTLDDTSGDFVLSSSGSFGTIKLIFSLTGTISDGKVSSATIQMTVYEGAVITGSFSADLVEIEEPVVKSSNVMTADTTSYGFEGKWTFVSEPGHVGVLTLTSTSWSFKDTYKEGGVQKVYSINGSALKVEALSGGKEWVVIPVEDNNYAEDWSGYFGIAAEIYGVFIARFRLNNDGTLTIVTIEDESEYYWLSNYNITSLLGSGTVSKYSDFKIENVILDSGESFLSSSVVTLASLVTLGKAINIDAPKANEYVIEASPY